MTKSRFRARDHQAPGYPTREELTVDRRRLIAAGLGALLATTPLAGCEKRPASPQPDPTEQLGGAAPAPVDGGQPVLQPPGEPPLPADDTPPRPSDSPGDAAVLAPAIDTPPEVRGRLGGAPRPPSDFAKPDAAIEPPPAALRGEPAQP